MLTPTQKVKIVGQYAAHEGDTGSPEVQVALFTEEIERLTDHLKKHSKDNSSRRGLLKMVSKRRKLLQYLKRESEERYTKVTHKLGLKSK